MGDIIYGWPLSIKYFISPEWWRTTRPKYLNGWSYLVNGSSTCLDETFTQHCYHFWQDLVQAKTFMSVQHWQLVIKVTIFKRFVVILAMFGISLSSSILCIYSSFILFYHPKISHICTWLTSHPISNYLKENQFANYLGTYVANWVPNIYCLIVKSILTTLLLYE